ncbi:DUF484 family protein [Methylococcus sp. EFPC2]|uniref:DUF484 family protein n=1 Tax=Methylococcus sp. EFPC2 TaxID=2812648 RepID=UPI001967A2C5|nr:DUF484 family protein [Methylococcus sp. EFPC2]QSA97241.1 DUF484 family protein [Methylococcus sp. EFPC2]
MSSNPLQSLAETLTATEVADFLSRHPDFFADHLELLEHLQVPHPSGQAVSLVAKQLDLLREKNRKLEAQLSEIVGIARDNDALFHRIHRLTLALLNAATLDEALTALRRKLHDCFDADFVSLRVLAPTLDGSHADLYVTPDTAELEHLQLLLESGQPECGQPGERLTLFLFGSNADKVKSHAVVPLEHGPFRGVLAIGSEEASRFEADMGHLFLVQLGEIAAARLAALVQEIH